MSSDYFHTWKTSEYALLGVFIVFFSLGVFSMGLRAYHEVTYIQSLRKCSQSTSTPCLTKMIVDTIHDKGLHTGMHMVKVWYNHAREFRPGCDALTRSIGRQLAHDSLDYTKLTFTPESAWCNYGVYHGFVEVFLERTEYDLERTRAFCEYVDPFVRGGAPGVRAECFRALGYGVAIVSARGNSLDEAIKKAIPACSSLTTKPSDTVECVSGIFSELGRIFAERPDMPTDADPLHICTELEPELRTPCFATFKWLPFTTFELSGVSTTVGYERILSIVGEENIQSMADTVTQLIWTMSYNDARRGTALSKKDSFSQGITVCMSLPDTFHTPCIQAFAFGLAKGGKPGYQYREVIAFCRQLADVSPDGMSACPAGSLAYLQDFYPKTIREHMCRIAARYVGSHCERR